MSDAYILRRGGGGVGVEFKLLWENAKPESMFANQIVNVDITEYQFFMVEHTGNSNSVQNITFLKKGVDSNLSFGSGYNNKFYSRQVKFVDNGFQFLSAYAASSTINNDMIIPLKIYGAKGVTFE